MPVRLPVQLPCEINECHSMIDEMQRDIQQYQARIDYLCRQLYGRKSERIEGGEPTFFDQDMPTTDVQAHDVDVSPDENDPKRKKRGNGRKKPPKDLPRERIEHEPSAEDLVCSDCQAQKKRIGENVSEQYDFIPSTFRILEHVEGIYACPCCQGNVVQGDKPMQLIPKSLAAPGLLAQILVGKYCDHLPLSRQSRIYERAGVQLSRSTLDDLALRACEELAPLVNIMNQQVLKSHVIHSDDTKIPVHQGKEKKGKTHSAYLWTYVGDDKHPFIVYDFTWTRGRDGPKDFLGAYKGFLQADAYGGYDGLFGPHKMTEVACWAHARRKFYDSRATDPIAAHTIVRKIKELYKIEKICKKTESYAEIVAIRRINATPILKSIKSMLDNMAKHALPKSPIGQATNYALNNWAALNRYVDDGRLAIDNNKAENAMRGIAVGRKNWLFAGSRRGGKAAAIAFSLIESAKRNKLEPFAYLRDIIKRLPEICHKKLAELLPNKWKPSE